MTPTSSSLRALLLAGLAFLLTACSADVSGTVHVATQSGDARRGADVPVLLVREQFMGEWTEASATFVDLSGSNRSYPFDLIRGEADVASAVTAPASSTLPPEAPHQPKWLAEELAKEKQGVADRREAKGGTWQLVQTVFRRRASAGEKFEDILKEIIANPDRFQSQAVVAESLAKDECRTVANRVSDGARTGRDRRYDYPNGVAFIRSDREAADTSGWTKRPRIEEAITVQVWVCVNAAKAAASR